MLYLFFDGDHITYKDDFQWMNEQMCIQLKVRTFFILPGCIGK